jgi:co-chaperonin GroES (HSP10)
MENTSGLKPVEYKILIKPEVVELKTSGGIFLPDISHEKEQQAQMSGILVAVSEMAFDEFKPPIPQVGDKVLFRRYAGIRDTIGPKDGAKYWFINDKDIIAIIEE